MRYPFLQHCEDRVDLTHTTLGNAPGNHSRKIVRSKCQLVNQIPHRLLLDFGIKPESRGFFILSIKQKRRWFEICSWIRGKTHNKNPDVRIGPEDSPPNRSRDCLNSLGSTGKGGALGQTSCRCVFKKGNETSSSHRFTRKRDP